MNYSVLMSVYAREKPKYLQEAIESVLHQTLAPSEFIIIKDGPLTKELNRVLESYTASYPELVKVISLRENMGLGEALRIGVKHCKYEVIGRMDSDDICHQDRFKKQISYLMEHPDVDVIGSWIQEFDENGDQSTYIRKVPSSADRIKIYSKKRNPLNHMTVVFRKQSILRVGSYQSFLWNEDYYLWVRLLNRGFKLENLEEVLVFARAGETMFQRRGGIKYVLNEVKLQREFYNMKFISNSEFITNVVTRTLVRVVPNALRSFIYRKFLRTAG
ncbi:glycosyltransferase [Fictibacillus nanhaiensis]|uniref:Glycosyltransferase n=2 Tax=Fictibacillus nanhaiensis TaxID=742169 RepID=A0ABS2ZMQ8_9BACL|nr:glycosyltransferase [Fictibacillus nanhaiensis]